MKRPIHLALFLAVLVMVTVSGSMLATRLTPEVILDEDPVALAGRLLADGRWQEVVHLARFSQRYMPGHRTTETRALLAHAEAELESGRETAQRFLYGAATGDVIDSTSLLGALSLDLLVLGDLRDLTVQGYREMSTGDGDMVIMSLAAAGLLLTLAPALDWVPAALKTLARGGRLSRPLRDEIVQLTRRAVIHGDVKPLHRLGRRVIALERALGSGALRGVLRRIDSLDDLERIARVAEVAPGEAYVLTRLAGVPGLRAVRVGGKHGGLLGKRVRFAAREARMLDRLAGYLPIAWLSGIWAVVSLLLLAKTWRLADRRSRRPRRRYAGHERVRLEPACPLTGLAG